ncbi:DUF2304 domain-containing protein [Butyrivibrio fibrisolvens]|uniref:DUF2304 domain-containing protein n=1 Tax=Butyrivibrio fibrisolvens TaxID=831 RepID=UPI00048A0BCB|nr:DUF2304 domain-containing protein [Butyrivibrio fibrisolvens]
MSYTLRILLLIASFFTACVIIRRIRKSRVKQEDTLFWVFFSVLMAVFGFFPQICYWICDIVEIKSPANLVYLIIIALLTEKLLTLSIQVSMLESKIELISAEVALRTDKNWEEEYENDSEEKPNELSAK